MPPWKLQLTPEDGGWTNRSTSTQEAKKWLLSVLSRALGKDPEMTTIHCLKSTALSWAGKAGLNAETRQVLGHHSTGKHSQEIYNRDLLAEPIRQLELILQHIRTGSFLPDASRSGMITEATVEDPSKSFRREESQSESSESSSTDSSSDAATLHSDQYPENVYDPMLEKEVWNPDFHMYKHRRTHVVRLLADGTASETFSCGLQLTADRIKVDCSRFLDFRKCKRCAAAKPIKDVGAMASAFKKQRIEVR